jgi:hypothetical protein
MQVLGRGELTFSERLAVERDYIENISIAHDPNLAMTIPPPLAGRVLVSPRTLGARAIMLTRLGSELVA